MRDSYSADPSGNRPRSIDLVPCLFLSYGMILLHHKQRAQDRIEGRESVDWSDDN